MSFDFDKAVKEIMGRKKITGNNGVSSPLIKELVETALETEMDSHIVQEVLRKKSKTKKVY